MRAQGPARPPVSQEAQMILSRERPSPNLGTAIVSNNRFLTVVSVYETCAPA